MRASAASNARTGTGTGRVIRSASAATAASASSAGSGRPFQATSDPCSASSGAAYSTRTPRDASARAVTRSCAPRPAGHASARALTTVTLARASVAAARPRNEHFRPTLSTRGFLSVRAQRDERVGDVHVDALCRVAHRRDRRRLGRHEVEQHCEAVRRAVG